MGDDDDDDHQGGGRRRKDDDDGQAESHLDSSTSHSRNTMGTHTLMMMVIIVSCPENIT